MVISLSKEMEETLILVVADSFQNHVVPLLKSDIAHILHCLDEWHSSSVSFLGLLLQVRSKSMSVVNVVAGPEVHAEHPCKQQFRQATIDKRTIVKQP